MVIKFKNLGSIAVFINMSMSFSIYFDWAKIYSNLDFTANHLYAYFRSFYVARYGILHIKLTLFSHLVRSWSLYLQTIICHIC